MDKKVEKEIEEVENCHGCEDCHCEDNHECEDCNCEECDCEDCDCEEGSCESIKAGYENKIKELEDKLVRIQADNINFRKRKEEEMMAFVKYANKDLVLEILPLLDNFERALNMDDSNLEDEVSKFLKGFKMIHDNFAVALSKFSVKEINGINKPFDPIYHEAVLKEQANNVEPGIVIEIMQKGYLLGDKVIRPAMVKVSE